MLVNIDIHQYEEAKTYLTFCKYTEVVKKEILVDGLHTEVMIIQIPANKHRDVCTMLLSKGIKLY